jgi:hypothetical protein
MNVKFDYPPVGYRFLANRIEKKLAASLVEITVLGRDERKK